MGKRTALSDITLTLGTTVTGAVTHSVEAAKEVVAKVFEMERQNVADAVYTEVCQGVDPYHNSTWQITVNTAGEFKYTVEFVSEVRSTQNNGAINRNALSERRLVEINMQGSNLPVTESEMMSLLEQVQKFEDVVARFGQSAIPQASYPVKAKGKSPYGGQRRGTIQTALVDGVYSACQID